MQYREWRLSRGRPSRGMCDIPAQVRDFVTQYRGMAVRPTGDGMLNLSGNFRFSATSENYPTITDAFLLRIRVPHGFPRELPAVFETGSRIPIGGEYHVNPDGSLCLGSRLRLLWKLGQEPTLWPATIILTGRRQLS